MNIVHEIYSITIPLLMGVTYFTLVLFNKDASDPVQPGTPLKTSLIFSVSAVVLLYTGWAAASIVESRMADEGLWPAFAMTFLVGVRIFWKAYKSNTQQIQFDLNQPYNVASLAIIRGINMLFVGVAVRFLEFSLSGILLLSGFAVLLMTFSGLIYSKQFGENIARNTDMVVGFLGVIFAISLTGLF